MAIYKLNKLSKQRLVNYKEREHLLHKKSTAKLQQ